MKCEIKTFNVKIQPHACAMNKESCSIKNVRIYLFPFSYPNGNAIDTCQAQARIR